MKYIKLFQIHIRNKRKWALVKIFFLVAIIYFIKRYVNVDTALVLVSLIAAGAFINNDLLHHRFGLLEDLLAEKGLLDTKDEEE